MKYRNKKIETESFTAYKRQDRSSLIIYFKGHSWSNEEVHIKLFGKLESIWK